MKWSPQQDEALSKAARWIRYPDGQQVFRIFGYAGTGKTTLAKHLAEGVDGLVLFAAYTGKAAHVLTQKGCPAVTIHSLIYHSRDKGKARMLQLENELEKMVAELKEMGAAKSKQQRYIQMEKSIEELKKEIREETENLAQPFFVKNMESIVKDAALVVIDECSMVDAQMGEDLLSFGTPVMVLGDPAQLPPVASTGYFTSHVTPDIMLTEIHRQAQESGIIQLATLFRNGEHPNLGLLGHDCEVMGIEDIDSGMVLVPDQLIVGKNVTRSSYNQRLRTLHGYRTPGDDNTLYPVPGDRVICLRNNNEQGLLNGAMFNVSSVGGVMDSKIYMEIVPEDESFSVEVSSHVLYFEGQPKDSLPYWERKEAEEFDYGYAITGHKSQGSQWDHVMVFDESYCFRKDWNRWAYTACTRAAGKLQWIKMR